MADAAHGGEAASAGLPQFDLSWFASQIFWLAVTFGLLYWLLSQALLPKLESAIEARAKKIDDDLGAAARANQEAQDALAAFERTLASARGDARGLAEAARSEAEGERAKLVGEAEAKMERRLAEAEARLAAAREAALATARAAGEATAQDIVARIAPQAA